MVSLIFIGVCKQTTSLWRFHNKNALIIVCIKIRERLAVKSSQMALFYVFSDTAHVPGRNSEKGGKVMKGYFLKQFWLGGQ